MTDFKIVEQNLKTRGYQVRCFSNRADAAAYLNSTLSGVTIGIGGSSTVKELGLYDTLQVKNTVFWHWMQDPAQARKQAMQTDVYLTSANALAETGEMVNIDGTGNRVSSTLFGHGKIIYIVGRNKWTADYAQAVWRTRNIAAPQRAKQLGAKHLVQNGLTVATIVRLPAGFAAEW